MTFERLLGSSASELEKLTDKELEAFFAPWLKFTRPELVEKPVDNGKIRKVKVMSEEEHLKMQKKQLAMEIARQLGIDLKY